jgi:nitrous oxidase accessory protein NosD
LIQRGQFTFLDCSFLAEGGSGIGELNTWEGAWPPVVIRGCTFAIAGGVGVTFVADRPVTIAECRFTGGAGSTGLYLSGDVRARLAESTFDGLSGGAVADCRAQLSVRDTTFSKCATAIRASGSAQVSVQASTVDGGYTGVSAHQRASISIASTDLHNCRVAILAQDSSDVLIVDAAIDRAQWGISVQANASAELAACRLDHCEVYAAGASGSAHLEIRDSTFQANAVAVQLIERATAVVEANTIGHSTKAGVLSTSSELLRVARNQFTGNGTRSISLRDGHKAQLMDNTIGE